MKKLIILSLIALAGFSSCKKDDHLTPEHNTVTYKVQCIRCIVSASTSPHEVQAFNVVGELTYKIKADSLNIALLDIQVPDSIYDSNVKSAIYLNDKLVSAKSFKNGRQIYGVNIQVLLDK